MVESVWDYPRPPLAEPSDRLIEIDFDGETIVATRDSIRILETSHPPVYYLPVSAFAPGVLRPSDRGTFCEFKGSASYFDVVGDGRIEAAAAWGYPRPASGYESLAGRVALYPARMDACRVDGESVMAQEGDFYGGWITSDISGPFKGAPGTLGW